MTTIESPSLSHLIHHRIVSLNKYFLFLCLFFKMSKVKKNSIQCISFILYFYQNIFFYSLFMCGRNIMISQMTFSILETLITVPSYATKRNLSSFSEYSNSCGKTKLVFCFVFHTTTKPDFSLIACIIV